MVEFIPAPQLKNKFGVFGHFYSVQVAPKRIVECRSVLEIVETAYAPAKAAVLSNRKPDAVFIMMNPGSSRPLVAADNRIHAEAIDELQILIPGGKRAPVANASGNSVALSEAAAHASRSTRPPARDAANSNPTPSTRR